MENLTSEGGAVPDGSALHHGHPEAPGGEILITITITRADDPSVGSSQALEFGPEHALASPVCGINVIALCAGGRGKGGRVLEHDPKAGLSFAKIDRPASNTKKPVYRLPK